MKEEDNRQIYEILGMEKHAFIAVLAAIKTKINLSPGEEITIEYLSALSQQSIVDIKKVLYHCFYQNALRCKYSVIIEVEKSIDREYCPSCHAVSVITTQQDSTSVLPDFCSMCGTKYTHKMHFYGVK